MAQWEEIESPEGGSLWNVPSYMQAASNHAVGSTGEGWGEQLTTADKVGYFVKSAALSGINGFYNTAVWAGNLFTEEDTAYRDTRDYIASYDENMGKYYEENKTAIDLAGFVATSFVPGMGGVKLFNAGAKALAAGREGTIGYNMAHAIGAIPGSREALVKAAVDEAATTSRAFSIANASTARAVAAGFGEQAMQALAFETAVAVTMHKNPILDSMDTDDLVKNIFTGALLGGAIGGVLNTATTAFKIKGAIKQVDELTADVTQLKTGVAGTSASDDLLIIRNDLEHTRINTKDGVEQAHWDELVERKYRQADEESRVRMTELAGGDNQLGNVLYESMANDNTATLTKKVLGLHEVAPVSEAKKLSQKYKSLIEDGSAEGEGYAVRYMRAWGDDMGDLSDDLPTRYLSDHLRKGEQITFHGNTVQVGSKMRFAFNPRQAHTPSLEKADEAMARMQWAYSPDVPRLELRANETSLAVSSTDIGLLTKAYREGFTAIRITDDKGELLYNVGSREEVLGALKTAKEEVAESLMLGAMRKGETPDMQMVAYVTDTPLGTLTGTARAGVREEDNLFFLGNSQRNYWNKIYANAARPVEMSSVQPWTQPRNVAMVYDLNRAGGVDNFQVEAMTMLSQRQKLQQQANDRAVLGAFGHEAELLPSMSEKVTKQFDRTGAGPGFVSYANGGYGSAQSMFEFVGKWTNSQKLKANEMISHTFNNVAQRLKNSPGETAELATILQKVRNSGELYTYNKDTGELLMRRAVQAAERGEPDIVARPGVDLAIKIESPAVRDFIETHMEVSRSRLKKQAMMRHAQGNYDDFDPGVFYAPQPNPDRFKYHAFVVDDNQLASTYHSTMLYADSPASLERQIAQARQQGFSVYEKDKTARYFEVRGQYEYSRGFNENYIDSRLRAEGTSAPMFPLTGSPDEMIDDILSYHIKKEHGLIREGVELKYSKEFGTLRKMGEEYVSLQTSSRSPSIFASREAKNPFQEYIDLALDKPITDKHPLWKTVNEAVTETTDRVWRNVGQVFSKAKGPYDLDEVNNIFKKHGMGVAATPAMMEAWVNHPAGRNAVTKAIRAQNSMLSTLILRLDPVNALNNALGSNVLLGAETSSVLRAIQSGSEKGAGELAQLMNITLPGTGDAIKSPAKLIANAYKNFFTKHDELVKKYEGLGIDVNLSKQFKLMIDDMTITGTETAAELETKTQAAFRKLKQLADTGEKWTGNKLAESMNRYVTANVMDQITDVAIKNGVMDSKTANTYINTFVNRVQGNLLASQRPQIFTGPVGQAIGLFQSYQFNIMQQLLRHVGEGSKKDALTLLGLQGTIYGMNGLPAFQAINTHIIGTASGNSAHRDAYTMTNETVGKGVGDWLMYGMASNMLIHPDLKINLYSRGDISPRTLTVVPTSLADVPIVSAYSKMFTGLKGMADSIGNGGDVWNTLLSGIEHGSINRPLAGLARVARGVESGVVFSTSGQGNVVAANDLTSLASLARISGAKPFDEAVVQDAVFRTQVYARQDSAKRAQLGKAIRTVITNGGTPSEEQMTTFQEQYAKAGGKQEEYLKWYMAQLRAANTPQANKIVESSKQSTYSTYLSTIMGGRVFQTPTNLLAGEQNEDGS